jgi:DNA invertase Pin-like site-specific DNA recombinase
MEKIESRLGPLDEVIPRLLSETEGSLGKTASLLGLNASTVSRWLSENGYVRKSIWVKEQQAS